MCKITKKVQRKVTLERLDSIQKSVAKAKREFKKGNIKLTRIQMNSIIFDVELAIRWIKGL